jgi:hypothetical protein
MNEIAGIQDIRTSAIYDFDGVIERVDRLWSIPDNAAAMTLIDAI